MNVECPHCGANNPVEEKLFASESRVHVECMQCHSNFAASAPTDDPQLPVDQTVALAVIEGPARGQVFRLTKPRIILGRSGADIVLYDPEVSRKHCMIEVRGSTATLVDLGTTNGTFVAGKNIRISQLEHMSKFRIGATTLVFTVTDKKSPESAAPPTLVVRTRR
jgi:predicted component of type VI protein secretion system